MGIHSGQKCETPSIGFIYLVVAFLLMLGFFIPAFSVEGAFVDNGQTVTLYDLTKENNRPYPVMYFGVLTIVVVVFALFMNFRNMTIFTRLTISVISFYLSFFLFAFILLPIHDGTLNPYQEWIRLTPTLGIFVIYFAAAIYVICAYGNIWVYYKWYPVQTLLWGLYFVAYSLCNFIITVPLFIATSFNPASLIISQIVSFLIPGIIAIIFGKKWNKKLRRGIARRNNNPIYLGDQFNDDEEDAKLRADLSPAATENTPDSSSVSDRANTSSFCHNCGNPLPGNSRFCPKCGAQIIAGETTTTPQNEIEPTTVPVGNVSLPENDNATTAETTSAPTETTENADAATDDSNTSDEKRKKYMIIGAIAGGIVLLGLIAWFLTSKVNSPVENDKDKRIVVADNLFFRSSPSAITDKNLIAKLPYGTELHLINRQGDWAEVEVEGEHGYVGWRYILPDSSFRLLDAVWGTTNVRDIVDQNRCRLAILDYIQLHSLQTGAPYWEINYGNEKGVKPNSVMSVDLKNMCDKFPEFAFIIENGMTHERRLAIYSFDPDTEEPINIFDQPVDYDGLIQDIRMDRNGNMQINFTGNRLTYNPETFYEEEEDDDPGCATLEELRQEEAEYQEQVAEVQRIAESSAEAELLARTKNSDDTHIEPVVDTNKVYTSCDVAPQFPGGEQALMRWISEHLRYPAIAKENNIQGRVVVGMTITKTGKPTDFKIVRSKDPDLDKEAIRVLKNLPDFIPGTIKGIPVNVAYNIPITFRLN